jgi:hypothetical protein
MPSNPLLHRRPYIALFLTLVAAGCARFPAGASISGKRIAISMTVAGAINSNYIYMIALRPSNVVNPIDSGPIPVVAPPWGNGFVAGNCNYYIRWDPAQANAYTIFQFQDSTLVNSFPIGIPISTTPVLSGGNTLQFELDLSQIAPSTAAATAYQSVQVNFLTMDRIPQGSSGSKNWDALGDSAQISQINTWLTIPLTTNGVYTNASFSNLEPTGDTALPDIDISDFSIQVRSQ